ncbi:Carboxypeptidase [Quillaja saponaria]|uniref:Carboxypeptidase n=1 Tax=Quillaja saponaria TaxID=32244 RepID=A0AAD7LC38_QUISA|nr:Carboxypeptidase [Quillaja saponaria]
MGPGCSSVAYGAAQELGPFLVGSNGHLTLNNFSWNKVANILFVEAPVGVGYSYTNNANDLRKLGDRITAIDSHSFLIGWFKRFPAFKSHNFYIAGESYAGHYVPQLADLIYERNKKGSRDSYINLKGFMIGNAVINDVTDVSGMFDYAWSHAIISDELYHSIMKECNFTNENQTESCAAHVRGFLTAYDEIDMYSIYTPTCLNDSAVAAAAASSSPSSRTHRGTGTSSNLVVSPQMLTRHELWHKLPSGYDPCTEYYVKQFFNREDVQRALHANVTGISYPYETCSGVIEGWTDSPDSILPILHKLLNAGLRIWIYSGDTDGRVPVTSTRYSINKMGLKRKEEWRAWFYKGQVAGWVEVYDGGLTLATVRGAGHQVPMFAPKQSLSLFTHFLSAGKLPSTHF